ncbi:anthranilate synthase component II [Lignipirellula cremea]|uniref:Anthranilate synthase component 2 n=1 Tax=Lignipirellula cremea TaxID=2528010 RepID=A0A518DTX7_9BACT|nr:aminodeoxychorismate/anthranilate synthase component II [Lignipirellula cremea]QDU95286.1 Anthranilate synthase component 2 [Lignipirellula cremea]
MILLIDNYDSFVHNLARYLNRLGQETRVLRNDAVGMEQIRDWQPQAIVLSPGPCTPDQAGSALEIVTEFWDRIPLLGVCLGHQTIAQALGGRIVRATQPMHGRTSPINHTDSPLFRGLPSPLTVCRYHSLIVDRATLPDCFTITAETTDGVIMGLEHRTAPVFGVQFHPESILTDQGVDLLANFLRVVGCPLPDQMPGGENQDPATLESPGETDPWPPDASTLYGR